MAWTKSAIEQFLTVHLAAGKVMDLGEIANAYHDPFMFAGPSGVRVIPVKPLLAALPARRAFFDSVGQQGTELVSFEETVLDDRYALVKAHLRMRFVRSDVTKEALLDSTFVLFDDGQRPRIVFHLDSENVEQALRDRGILPRET